LPYLQEGTGEKEKEKEKEKEEEEGEGQESRFLPIATRNESSSSLLHISHLWREKSNALTTFKSCGRKLLISYSTR